MSEYWIGFIVLVGGAGWSVWKATRPVPKDRPTPTASTADIGKAHLTRGPERERPDEG